MIWRRRDFRLHCIVIYITTDPNVGLVNVPDARLERLGLINKSEKVVPAVVSFLLSYVLAAAHGGPSFQQETFTITMMC